MELKELCKECLLYNEPIHKCPFCTIDFENEKSKQNAFRSLFSKKQDIQIRANTTLNINNHNIDIVRYKEEFSVTGNRVTCNRSRKWQKNCAGVWCKKNKDDPRATIDNMQACRKRNRKRGLNSFLSYGQNNDWQYFITMTFDPHKVDSSDQEKVKYAWKLFRQKMQYYYPDIKIICVIEYHADDNKLHFHGCLGGADISPALVRAVNMQPFRKDKKGCIITENNEPVRNKYYMQPLESNLGDSIYNFRKSVYDKGFCSIIPLTDRNNDLSAYDKIIFYLAKYMSKDKSAVPYCGKSYFATRNLKKGQKICLYMSDEEFNRYLSLQEEIQLKKEKEHYSSYVQHINIDQLFSSLREVYQPMDDDITCEDILQEVDNMLTEEDPIFME